MTRAPLIVVNAGLALVLWAGASPTAQEPTANTVPPSQGAVAFQGNSPEKFLHSADVTHIEEINKGVTRPRRVTLERDGVTHDAAFKWIDERRQGITTLEDGTVDTDFWDSWQAEVAAYRLDRLIGLGMVPATVDRPVRGQEGSLQWWVDDAVMSEEDRIDKGLRPPDLEDWTRQTLKVRLFDELISNVDRHMNNLLITEDFQIRLIDHSRSFRSNRGLQHPEKLSRFSRSLLEGLERLNADVLEKEIGYYVGNDRIERLLDRRDAILALARERVERFGEDAILYR